MATITSVQRHTVTSYALDQVGKPYLWLGVGDGPAQGGEKLGGFDCSGLVMSCWRRVGVTLPHQSGAQAELLKAVPYTSANRARLQLGDLAFYYGSPFQYASITHVGIYVGDQPVHKKFVVAAVDSAHGVMKHRMLQFLTPSALGYVGHS